MTLRGNFLALHISAVISGIVTFFACLKFGDYGLLAFFIFVMGMILTLKKDHDEREVALSYKVNTVETTMTGCVMGLVYVAFPEANWFHILISAGLLFKGISGIYIHLRN
ncbi:hypothetical protein ACFL4T_07140 [candidate division KSB1 bacterium]